jgi:RimJ/RimL family protein N-acetyltransferase
MSTIRKLFPAEADLLRAHLKRLDETARRLRFGLPTNDTSIDQTIERIDWLNSLHLGYFVDGVLRGSAQLAWSPWRWRNGAEFAVSLETPFQNHGVGTELLRRAITAARNRGIGRLTLICLHSNQPMVHVALKFGADLVVERGEVEGVVPLAQVSHASLFDEALDDGAAWLGQWLEQVRLPGLLVPILTSPATGDAK